MISLLFFFCSILSKRTNIIEYYDVIIHLHLLSMLAKLVLVCASFLLTYHTSQTFLQASLFEPMIHASNACALLSSSIQGLSIRLLGNRKVGIICDAFEGVEGLLLTYWKWWLIGGWSGPPNRGCLQSEHIGLLLFVVFRSSYNTQRKRKKKKSPFWLYICALGWRKMILLPQQVRNVLGVDVWGLAFLKGYFRRRGKSKYELL